MVQLYGHDFMIHQLIFSAIIIAGRSSISILQFSKSPTAQVHWKLKTLWCESRPFLWIASFTTSTSLTDQNPFCSLRYRTVCHWDGHLIGGSSFVCHSTDFHRMRHRISQDLSQKMFKYLDVLQNNLSQPGPFKCSEITVELALLLSPRAGVLSALAKQTMETPQTNSERQSAQIQIVKHTNTWRHALGR